MAVRELVKSVGFVVILTAVMQANVQGVDQGNLENLKSVGDITVGYVEHLCMNSSCADINIDALLKVEAILYAVNNANKRAKDNGLNITLGYYIGDSSKDSPGSHKTLYYLLENSKNSKSPIVVVGYASYNRLLLLLSQDVTHISCNSSPLKLPSEMKQKSDRVFRVQPTDLENMKAILSVISRNKWSYVGVVMDEGAESIFSILKSEAGFKDVCIGNVYKLPDDADQQQVSNIVKTLNSQKNVSVVIALTSNRLTKMILKEASEQRVHDLTWITGQRSWPSTKPIPLPNSAAQGMFSVVPRRTTPGFVDYLRSLYSGNQKIDNVWLRQAAAKDGAAGNNTPACNYDANPMCGMDTTKLKNVVDQMIDLVGDAGCTIDAVTTIARALELKQRCVESSDCDENTKAFIDFMRQVDFTNSLTSSEISFTEDQTLNSTRFHVYNYQQNYSRITTDLNKNLKAVDVGSYFSSSKGSPELKISESRIEWHGGHNGAPKSRCHKECGPSFYRHLKQKRSGAECCWECQKCPNQQYSDESDLLQCKKCPETHRPSVRQTECIPYLEDYVHWNDGGSVFILFLMVVGLCFSIYVAVVLFRNSETPIVRRAKSGVLCLLPFVIILFLLPIPLIGRPTESSCEGYRVFFLIALGVPLSVLIAKSHFFDHHCHEKSENGDACWTPRLSIACFFILLHVLLAVILGLTIPAKVIRLPTDDPYTVFLECSYHSNWEFEIVVFFHFVLAVVVAILSINEVITEENNNEVRWISLAMFNWYAITFFYVIFMFGVHFHAKVIVLSLMCILHAVNLLVLIYVPKWYIAVFRPEKNRSDVSPWTDYIKTQEKVSERLSAPEGSPIMTRKGKEGESNESKGLMTDTDI